MSRDRLRTSRLRCPPIVVGYPHVYPQIDLPSKRIEAFCRKWKATEFALFGSVLTDEFRPDSNVDVLVTFSPDAPWSLWDLGDMRDELTEMFGRKVDLVE